MKYQQLVAMPASVQDWLDHELEMRGIDAVVYTRYILSILLQQDTFDSETTDRELFPAVAKRNLKETPVSKSKGKSKLRAERKHSLNCEEMKKSAAVECLMSVSEQKCGIEKLVDELCDKLKNIQGTPTTAVKTDHTVELFEQPRTTISEKTTGSLASSSPQEQAEKYYAAFPALSGKLEPSEKPEALPPLDTTMATSVWDTKKVAPKAKSEAENEEKKICSDVIDDRKSDEENESEKNDKDEEKEGKKTFLMEENNKQVQSNNNSKGYFKMKVESEPLEKSIGGGSIKSYVETWGNKVAQEAAFVKPSFIVPKCRTSGTRRHHPKMAMKGKSPFTLTKPKVNELATVRHVRKKICNSSAKSRYPPVMRQHSEENTEESSSLDNSFDEEADHSAKSNSKTESGRYNAAAGVRQNSMKNEKSAPSLKIDSDGGISGGEAEVLAKLAAKFNDRVAAIWSDEKHSGDLGPPLYHKATSMTDNIWQVLPFYSCVGSSHQQQLEPPLTPPLLSGFFPHDLKNLFGGSLAKEAVHLPVVTSESCSVWLNPLSERPSTPSGSLKSSSPLVLRGGKSSVIGRSAITPKDGQEVDTFGIAVPECQTSYSSQVYEDLMNNSLWQWQADRPFIQGGVYGSASEFPEAPWRLMQGGAVPISFADLDANGCSTPSSSSSEQDSLLESEPESPKCSTPSHDDEMQLVWEILGKLGNTIQDDSGEPSPVGQLSPIDDTGAQVTSAGFGDGLFSGDRRNSWQRQDGADLAGNALEGYLDHLWRPPLSQPSNETSPCQLMKLEDTLIDLKAIWNSMHNQDERDDLVPGGGVQIHVLTPHYPLPTSDDGVETQVDWNVGLSDQLLGPPPPPMEPGSVSLTRSYDSYLNKVLREKSSENEEGLSSSAGVENGEFAGNIFRSEPSLFTYHKGESRFVEVKPMPKDTRLPHSMIPPCSHPLPLLSSQPPLDMMAYQQHSIDEDESDAHENLLTSPKTHFRPIRQDSCETDTTASSEAGDDQATVATSTIAAASECVSDAANAKSCDKEYRFGCRGLQAAPHADEDVDDSSDELAFLALGCNNKRGNGEKFCQTEGGATLQELGNFLSPPIQCSSGVIDPKEEEDACTQILNAVIDVLDTMLNTRGILEGGVGSNSEEGCHLEDDDDEGDDDEGDDLSDSSSTSLSPVSSKDESGESVSELDLASSASGLLQEVVAADSGPSALEFGNPLYRKPEQDRWGATLDADVLAHCKDSNHVDRDQGTALLKWSTAQEEHPFWMEEGEENNNANNNIPPRGIDAWSATREKASPCNDSTCSGELVSTKEKQVASDDEVGRRRGSVSKVKSLRDEIKEEEEQLFEDIDQLRILGLDEGAWDDGGLKDHRTDWLLPDLAVGSVMDEAADEDISAELEMINKRRQLAGSSCDGDDDEERAAFADGILYSDYFFELQNADDLSGVKLPVVPTSKALYSTDLEEEWRKNGKPFDVQVPKNKCISKKDYSQKRPCSFYLEGNCRRSDCKFSHDLASITCRFWEEGSCFKGITCPFLHGYRSTADKENADEKSGFQLELESEAHFPTLGKPRIHIRKQDLCHSSSSDSMPMTQNRRRRKRCPGRQRVSSPHGQAPLVKCAKPNRHQQLVLRKKPSKGSSSEEDTMDI